MRTQNRNTLTRAQTHLLHTLYWTSSISCRWHSIRSGGRTNRNRSCCKGMTGLVRGRGGTKRMCRLTKGVNHPTLSTNVSVKHLKGCTRYSTRGHACLSLTNSSSLQGICVCVRERVCIFVYECVCIVVHESMYTCIRMCICILVYECVCMYEFIHI